MDIAASIQRCLFWFLSEKGKQSRQNQKKFSFLTLKVGLNWIRYLTNEWCTVISHLIICIIYNIMCVMFSSVSVQCKGTTRSSDMVKCEAMMKLVLYCVDRIRRFKLGKEVSVSAIHGFFSTSFTPLLSPGSRQQPGRLELKYVEYLYLRLYLRFWSWRNVAQLTFIWFRCTRLATKNTQWRHAAYHVICTWLPPVIFEVVTRFAASFHRRKQKLIRIAANWRRIFSSRHISRGKRSETLPTACRIFKLFTPTDQLSAKRRPLTEQIIATDYLPNNLVTLPTNYHPSDH